MDSGDPSLLSPSGSSLLRKQISSVSLCDSEDEEHHYATVASEEFVPSPLLPLKKQLELDKEDESLRRWKEQLLGGITIDQSDEKEDPEVDVVGLSILAKGRAELNIPLPLPFSKAEVAFVLQEGSSYHLKFTFTVQHNLVSGLTYLNTVWRCGVQVDQTRTMLGTFSPQREPYVHVLDEETTPAGFVALGVYTAKTKFVDDDGRCYLEADYSFEIRKDW